jgi:hypothetical protein
MSSAIKCVKAESPGLPDHGPSPSSVLPCKKRVRHFFTAEIWSDSSPDILVSSISISGALRPLRVKKRTTDGCSISHFLRVDLPKMKHCIIARHPDWYPWMLYYWIAYFVRNTDMTELSLHFQQVRNKRGLDEFIHRPRAPINGPLDDRCSFGHRVMLHQFVAMRRDCRRDLRKITRLRWQNKTLSDRSGNWRLSNSDQDSGRYSLNGKILDSITLAGLLFSTLYPLNTEIFRINIQQRASVYLVPQSQICTL